MNTIYFSKLYPNQADYSKIDLTSLQFYRDTVDLYCQKKSEREKLIRGIKYLSFKIKNEDELNPVLEAWATAMYSFNVREVFAERKHTPNLVTEFKDKVAKILKEREIDKYFGFKYLFLIIFFILGFAAGIYEIYKAVKRELNTKL